MVYLRDKNISLFTTLRRVFFALIMFSRRGEALTGSSYLRDTRGVALTTASILGLTAVINLSLDVLHFDLIAVKPLALPFSYFWSLGE